MSANSVRIDIINSGVVSVEEANETRNMVNRGNRGLTGEFVVGGVRVFGEGGELGEGLRAQMEGLDVGVDLGSSHRNGQLGFSGYDLGVNENAGVAGRKNDMKSAENIVSDAQRGLLDSNTFEGIDLQDVLGGKTEKNDSEAVNINGNHEDGVGVLSDALVPEKRGDKHRMEEEGKFYVSDLVWCKVRTYPWWPGQIFEPSAASDSAMKYFKEDSYLIACFGDQTFAWSEASCIKPFRMYFSQLEKQRNKEGFTCAVDCALDEVSRRVEFGLACSCLPEETRAKVKYQIVMNAGIREESSVSVGGDNFSDVTSFNPTDLVRSLKSVAAAPHFGIDRLSFVVAKAQLVAFNRWKGYYELPVIDEFGELKSDDDVEPQQRKEDDSYVARGSSEVNSNHQVASSGKRHRRTGVDERPHKKEKSLSDLMSESSSGMPNDLNKSRRRAGGKRKSMPSEKRHLSFDSMPGDSMAKRRKKVPMKFSAIGGVHKAANLVLKSADSSSRKRTGKLSEKSKSVGPVKPEERQLIPEEFPPPTEMLSKLYLAARDPMNGYSILASLGSLFCYYRSLTSSETTESGDGTEMTEKHKVNNSSNSVAPETSSLGGIEDSYWTDRIIQYDPEDQVLFEREVQNQEYFSNAKWETSPGLSPSVNSKQEDFPNTKSDLVDGNSEYSPTALILNFSDLESIHSVADLNRIFSQYGPLNESETDIIVKSKRAKVVFKRRADAETAFSKSGKFRIFGPSLLSYRLDYSPSPRKASSTQKRKRKYAASVEVDGV